MGLPELLAVVQLRRHTLSIKIKKPGFGSRIEANMLYIEICDPRVPLPVVAVHDASFLLDKQMAYSRGEQDLSAVGSEPTEDLLEVCVHSHAEKCDQFWSQKGISVCVCEHP